MKIDKNSLKIIKELFEQKLATKQTSYSSKRRYQSWIRRYIKYCIKLRLDLNSESIRLFLMTYENNHTRRQGYYALKFFNSLINHKNEYFEYYDCTPESNTNIGNSKKRFKWFFRY